MEFKDINKEQPTEDKSYLVKLSNDKFDVCPWDSISGDFWLDRQERIYNVTVTHWADPEEIPYKKYENEYVN